MRINGSLLFPVTPLKTTSLQSGASLLFEDLLSAPPQEGGVPIRTPSAQVPRLFGFDTLGVLGMGSHPNQGRTQTVKTAVGATHLTATDSLPLQSDGERSHLKPSEPVTAPQVMTATAAGNVPDPAQGTTSVAEPALIRRPDLVGPGVLLSTASGVSGPAPYVVVEPMESPAISVIEQASILPRNPLSRFGQGAPVPDRPASDEPETPGRLRLAAETSQDSLSGQVSVLVSERDGVVHVTAAASALTEEARLKLRGLAQDIAYDAGVTLGGFSFNGTAVPEFFPSVRSFPWPSQA